MNNILEQIFISEDNNEEPPPENEPPSKMCNIKEDSLYSGLFILYIDRWWSLFIRSKGLKTEYNLIPSVSHMLHR